MANTETKTNEIKLTDGENVWGMDIDIYNILSDVQTCEVCIKRFSNNCGNCKEGLEHNYVKATVVNE